MPMHRRAAPARRRGTSAAHETGRRRAHEQAPGSPRSRSLVRGCLGSQAGELAQCCEPRQCLAFELPDALARQVELVADRLERPRLALEAEPQLEDAPLALRQSVECLADVLAAERLLRLVERVRGLAIGEEVAEFALVVRADRLVQRDGRGRGGQCLVDVLQRQARCLGQLFLRRLAAPLPLEPARRARQLLLALDDVHRHADRARVVCDRALHALADPPGRVRRELVATAPVELLDRAVQPERALLDQVQKRDAEAAVALRDRHDEAQVRLDHATLGAAVAPLDRLRQHDLFMGGQQLVLADVGQEELQAVARAGGRVGFVDDRLGLSLLLPLLEDGLAHFQPDPLELTHHFLLPGVVQVVLDRERLELGRFDPAALLTRLDQRAGALGLKKFGQLALGQFGIDVLSFLRPASLTFQTRADAQPFLPASSQYGRFWSSDVAGTVVARFRSSSLCASSQDRGPGGLRATRRHARSRGIRPNPRHAGWHWSRRRSRTGRSDLLSKPQAYRLRDRLPALSAEVQR